MQPHRSERCKAADRAQNAQQESDREKSLLEGAQRLRQRQARKPFERAWLPGQGKIQHPRADRKGERDDRCRRRAFGNAGSKQRDGADQQAVEQMAENKIGGFGSREMPAEGGPDHRGRCRRDERGKPSDEDRSHLGGDQRRHTIGQLHQQAQRARFLLAAERSNRHEGKQQRHDDVERAKCGHQHAIERRQSGSEHGRIPCGRACLAVEDDGLPETVADERAEDQQHDPQRTAARDLPQLLGEQGMERRPPHDCCLR